MQNNCQLILHSLTQQKEFFLLRKIRKKSVAQSCFSCLLIPNSFAHSMQLVAVFTRNLCDMGFFFWFFARKTFQVSLDTTIPKFSPSVQAPSGVHVHFWVSTRQCIHSFRSSNPTPLAFPWPDFLERLGDAG